MNIHADNLKIYVRAMGRDAFEQAMSLAFNGGEAKYWAVTESWGLCYFWYVEDGEKKRTKHHHMEIQRGSYSVYDHTEDGQTLYVRDNDTAFWEENYLIKKFPEPMSVGRALDHAWSWLNDYNTRYPPEPDIDGSCSKGFIIGTQEGLWHGHLGSHRGVICYVKPDWMWHGK